MRITLFRDDGSILARNFDVSDLEENRTQINPAMFRLIDGVESRTGLTGGQETPDSFNEMWAVERSSYLPIGIMASLPRELILREWENQAIRFVIIGGTLSAILILLTLILARLVRQLEQTRNSALAAAGAKSRFVASVSHELRTPMNAIIGGAHQLLQTKLTPDAERYVQMVSSSAQQLTVLINDILDFSYFESRDFRIEKAPFEPRNMAHNAMEMTRALVPNSKLELIYKIDEKVPPFIIGDSSRIKQVILNLLSNAVKYTEKGQVELRISYVRGKENLLILQVHDTGPGISPEDQTRIFEPFERTNAARKRPGTGLGLTISKKLVEAMKGTISLTSTLGQGACFTIELPAPPASAFEANIDATKPPVDFSKILRILVAEDVAPSRVLLTVMLTNLGHNVTAVENGLEALQIASEMPFDLILMDLQMPEMDGVTATQRIRASKGPNRHTRILAVSANADVDGPNGLAAAGFDDALLKPIKPERLRFLLNEIVAQI